MAEGDWSHEAIAAKQKRKNKELYSFNQKFQIRLVSPPETSLEILPDMERKDAARQEESREPECGREGWSMEDWGTNCVL